VIDISRAIPVIKDLTCLVGNSSKASMKDDMLDINVIKFFCINTCTGKILRPLPVRWEFPSPGWIKINIDGAARGNPDLAICGGIFRGSMGEFIGAFFAFLEVQTAMVVEFCGVIHAMEETQKMGVLLMYSLNVILLWFVLHLLAGLVFRGCFVISGILILITVGKSGLGLLIFFVKGMRVLISWLILDLFIENHFIGIIGFHLVCFRIL